MLSLKVLETDWFLLLRSVAQQVFHKEGLPKSLAILSQVDLLWGHQAKRFL